MFIERFCFLDILTNGKEMRIIGKLYSFDIYDGCMFYEFLSFRKKKCLYRFFLNLYFYGR